LAVICVIPQLYNAHRWGVYLTALPRLQRVEAALVHIPGFLSAHPDRFDGNG